MRVFSQSLISLKSGVQTACEKSKGNCQDEHRKKRRSDENDDSKNENVSTHTETVGIYSSAYKRPDKTRKQKQQTSRRKQMRIVSRFAFALFMLLQCCMKTKK